MFAKHQVIFSIFFLFSLALHSQTVISTPTTWDQDTIFITETVVVDGEGSLTIAAGTTVLFEAGTGLEVHGNMWSNGTEGSPVVLSGKDSVFWNGIYLAPTSDDEVSSFFYTEIYFGNNPNGGAIHLDRRKKFILDHCKVMYNKGNIGGGIHSYRSNGSIKYSLIAANVSDNATVYIDYSNFTIRNTTIANNRSNGVGGIYTNSLIDIFNSILALNDSSNLFVDRSSRSYPLTPRFSLIEEGFQGNSNLAGDPIFTNISKHDYSLSAGSPAIDAGCHCFLDDDGTRSDMGYEYRPQTSPQPLPYILIDSTSNLNNTWSDQDKFYAICSNLFIDENETLQIKEGVQVQFVLNRELNIAGQLIVNGSEESPVKFSGLDSTYYEFEAEDIKPVKRGWSGINFMNGKTNRISNAIFTQLGSNYNFNELYESTNNVHLGVYENSSLEIEKCTFLNNTVHYYRDYDIDENGLLYVDKGCDIKIVDSKFINNKSYETGAPIISSSAGGLEIHHSSLSENIAYYLIEFNGGKETPIFVMDSCQFTDNQYLTTYSYMLKYNGSSESGMARITNNRFVENIGSLEIGGPAKFLNNVYSNNQHSFILFHLHDQDVIGNLIHDNSGFNLIFYYNKRLRIHNNTIAFNETDERSITSISSSYNYRADFTNNIFYENSPRNFVSYFEGYGDVENRTFKSNFVTEFIDNLNYTRDPLFKNAAQRNFDLSANSPAIDAALEGKLLSILPTSDVLGSSRIDDRQGKLDIGAIEFQGEVSSMNDIILSDTIVYTDMSIGESVSGIFTEEQTNAAFTLLADPGYETQAFIIEENSLLLNKEVNEGDIYRIKIRAEENDKDAWLEKSFFIHVSFPLGLDESMFQIYPNPAPSYLNLPVNWIGKSITISDLSGKTIRFIPKLKTTKLKIGTLKDNTYFIHNGTESHTFIKLSR